MKKILNFVLIIWLSVISLNAFSAPVTIDMVKTAAETFITQRYPSLQKSDIRTVTPVGSSFLSVADIEALEADTVAIGFIVNLQPSGYVLMRADDMCPPLKLYSDRGTFSEVPPNFVDVLKWELTQELGRLHTAQRNKTRVVEEFTDQWEFLLHPTSNNPVKEKFTSNNLRSGNLRRIGEFSLETNWHQGDPYNHYAPNCGSRQAPAGCVAIALAQILRYHRWPTAITGNPTSTDDDGDCTGAYAASDAGLGNYDWAHMFGTVSPDDPISWQEAVGQLIYHSAVAVDMNFEAGISGADSAGVVNALRNRFSYTCSDYTDRFESDSEWYNKIDTEIINDRPVYYRFGDDSEDAGHAVVVHGTRNGDEIFINMGWRNIDETNAWYDMNDINDDHFDYHWNDEHRAIFEIRPTATSGYASLSQGVSISPTPVIIGQNFNVSFTLKELRGIAKTFENIAVAMLDANGNFLFDFYMYGVTTIPAHGTLTRTATNYLYGTRPPGLYKLVIRGKVGGQWFDFDTVDSGVNPKSFQAITQPTGYASVSQGVTVSPAYPTLGQNFDVSFTLKEVRGVSKTFENVVVAILDAGNNHVFDFYDYGAVTIPAYGTWSRTARNYLYESQPPGTYKAIIRGKIGGQWFDFDTVDGAVNPQSFRALSPYRAEYVTQAYYPENVAPGQDAVWWIEFKNVGTKTWYNTGANEVKLGTGTFSYNDIYYSNIYHGRWLDLTRPTRMDQSSVAPGGIARFTFRFHVPANASTTTWSGNYNVTPVVEGIRWMKNTYGDEINAFMKYLANGTIPLDQYESNNSESAAYPLSLSFSGNSATRKTNGANLHTTSDLDYYQLNLPTGYDYTISLKLHDSYNSTDGQTYTGDVRYWYKHGSSWLGFYTIETSQMTVTNGGIVYVKVDPYQIGNVGTYALDITVTRTLNPGSDSYILWTK